ncbi:hypothetical protein [Streptomyces wuyuanensis]|uniref:hypothetical protein n=1 Tax=Streptomyces wuyuanensis TaxID=1196353 RepID=UPI0037228643
MYVFSALTGAWYVVVGALILARSGPSGFVIGLLITVCGCTMTASSVRARRGNLDAPRHVRRSGSTILAVLAVTAAWWAATLIYTGDYAMFYAARDQGLGPVLAVVTAPAVVVTLVVRRRKNSPHRP